MSERMTRREVLTRGAVLGTAAIGTGAVQGAGQGLSRGADGRGKGFQLCFNTSTLRARKMPIIELIDVVAGAGFDAIEVWVDEIERHVVSGGTLKDLRKRLADRGLAAVGAIAFFEWMVDDGARRARGLDKAKQAMAKLSEIGCTHIAAPPCGNVKDVDLLSAAERYRTLLALGDELGVIPAVEIWGPAKNLHRLGQAVLVALEADHPRACILPDVYHLYRGGSGLSSIGKLSAKLLAGFHLNDYPADPPRDKLTDRHRVYPGDGIAPLAALIRDLEAIGYRGPLSVELFNPDYARQDPAVVARTALAKTRAVIRSARAGS